MAEIVRFALDQRQPDRHPNKRRPALVTSGLVDCPQLAGRVGALVCELTNTIRFRVRTGLADSDREHPPTIGETIIVKFFELTNAGVPRFPSFVGVRAD